MTADVVGFSGNAFCVDEPKSLGMVFHIEPVTDVLAFSVDWQLLAVEGVEDNERNQLLREVERAVVVGAVADEDGKFEGVAPCADEMVAGGL